VLLSYTPQRIKKIIQLKICQNWKKKKKKKKKKQKKKKNISKGENLATYSEH